MAKTRQTAVLRQCHKTMVPLWDLPGVALLNVGLPIARVNLVSTLVGYATAYGVLFLVLLLSGAPDQVYDLKNHRELLKAVMLQSTWLLPHYERHFTWLVPGNQRGFGLEVTPITPCQRIPL